MDMVSMLVGKRMRKKFTKREVRETAFVGVYIDRVGG